MSRAIQIQQKKAIRAIPHLPHNHLPHVYFRDHSIMKIEGIHKLNLSTILFEYKKRRKNDHICRKFGRIIELQNHNTVGHWSSVNLHPDCLWRNLPLCLSPLIHHFASKVRLVILSILKLPSNFSGCAFDSLFLEQGLP